MDTATINDSINRIESLIGSLSQEVVELRRRFGAAGLATATDGPHGQLKLHEAMAVVLRQRGNNWTKISDVAKMINTQGLYVKGDGTQVEPNQLHARANRPTYRPLFEKDGPLIRLSPQGL